MKNKNDLTFGYIPLTDCAVLAVAKERGFFKRHGLNVELQQEASWANIRDKVSIGALDGAHMLAPMPIASSLGLDGTSKPMITAFSMGLNGNAITVSRSLYKQLLSLNAAFPDEQPVRANALKQLISQRRSKGLASLKFSHVYPYSKHNYELRYWLAAGLIDPDKDVSISVTPPPRMVDNLHAGSIDGFCVGEPWNEEAVCHDTGRILITGYEIWNNSPEKVFAVTQEWSDQNPETHLSIIRALSEAAEWMDRLDNRMEVVKILTENHYVNVPSNVLRMSMLGSFHYTKTEAPKPLQDFNVFYHYAANYPWVSHAVWFMTQMIRWGQLNKPTNLLRAAREIYRPDIYIEATRELGLPRPNTDIKQEGAHNTPWLLEPSTAPIPMGADCFFDGKIFDSEQAIDYLNSFEIKHSEIDFNLWKACQ